MNHILVRNKKTGSPQAPQGVDRYFPYADGLTSAEGEALLAIAKAQGTVLGLLLAAMPGTNRLRATDPGTPATLPLLGYLGRNGDGAGGGSLSVYTNGPGAGVKDQELYTALVATGTTPAYASTPVKMAYKAEGWPREGDIPVSDPQRYASLMRDLPNGTYRLEFRSATALLSQIPIEVTNDGPELAIRQFDNVTTPPSTTDPGSSSAIYAGGTISAPATGSDDSGQAWNTSTGAVLTEN